MCQPFWDTRYIESTNQQGETMSKVTKTQLQDAADTHARRVRVDFPAAVGAAEKAQAAGAVRLCSTFLLARFAPRSVMTKSAGPRAFLMPLFICSRSTQATASSP